MDLKTFLNSPTNTVFAHSRVIMQGKEAPAFFLAQLFNKLKKTENGFGVIDAEIRSLAEVQALLSMSFLGNRMLYAIKNISGLDAAQKKVWNAYLNKYQGPHSVLYFSSTAKEAEGTLIVELPEKVDRVVYRILSTYFSATEQDQYFIEKLFQQEDTLTLDEACLLIGYHSVVGRKCESFFNEWFSRLVIPQKSLFTLSQYFFAQRPREFLELWKKFRDDLPDEFWIAYWSEQVWQAALFVMRARSKGIIEAKKGIYRLPFSFINKDWQKYTSESLTAAHSRLTMFDYLLKNGAGGHGLELWYHHFLNTRVSF